MGDWCEFERGDNYIMGRGNKRIIFFADDCFKLVRMAGRIDNDVQLAVTGTIAYEMVIGVMRQRFGCKIVSV